MWHRKFSSSYIKEFFVKYPVILSGYIIYGYLFISIVRLLMKKQNDSVALFDAYDIFIAFAFMWLLAVSLVKVIEYRSKLHEKQVNLALRERILQLKEMKFEQIGLFDGNIAAIPKEQIEIQYDEIPEYANSIRSN